VVISIRAYGERLGEVKALEATNQGIGDFLNRNAKDIKAISFTGKL